MKKIFYLLSVIILLFFSSCIKNNDFVKEELEKALPPIEITSMGLLQQVGPFAQSDVIQVTFGGAITKAQVGTFDIAWYTAPATGAATRVDSVHFNGWTVPASASTANNAISTTLIPTSYPNTYAFSGNLILKLSTLPAGSKQYTLRAYVRSADNKMASVTLTKFITIK